MTYDDWLLYARSITATMPTTWRGKSLHVMLMVTEHHVAVHAQGDAAKADTKKLFADLRRSYPFGERKMWPYKAWLGEIGVLRQAFSVGVAASTEEQAACEVASDLVELGRADEAMALLNEQAPDRLDRACSSCGAKRGCPCREVDLSDVEPDLFGEKRPLLARVPLKKFTTKIVPCAARYTAKKETT